MLGGADTQRFGLKTGYEVAAQERCETSRRRLRWRVTYGIALPETVRSMGSLPGVSRCGSGRSLGKSAPDPYLETIFLWDKAVTCSKRFLAHDQPSPETSSPLNVEAVCGLFWRFNRRPE